MPKDRLIKLVAFNAGLCLAYILLFSRAFLGISFSAQNALATAFGAMAIVTGVGLFGFVNYRLLIAPPPPGRPAALPPAQALSLLTGERLSTLDGCAEALSLYIEGNVDTFAADLRTAIKQIERMKRKKDTIRGILLERFSDTEMSFAKFEGAIAGVENIMLRNVQALLHRVTAFDEEEYEDALRAGAGSAAGASGAGGAGSAAGAGGAGGGRLAEARQAIMREYTSFVSRSVEDNEEILLRLDKLILEVSKLGDLHEGVVEDLPAMRDIDALIGDTKWYK